MGVDLCGEDLEYWGERGELLGQTVDSLARTTLDEFYKKLEQSCNI
jgi:hypothetical protein